MHAKGPILFTVGLNIFILFPLTFKNLSFSPILKQKSNLLSQNWYFFSLSSAKYGNSNLGFVLPDKKRKKKPSKVGSYGKIEEIFITALAAKTTQKAESCTNKNLLMQDWVFRLGQKGKTEATHLM